MKLAYRKKGNATQRRKAVIKRLKKQLADGVKLAKVTETNFAGITSTTEQRISLTEADKQRIKAEIATLEARV